MDKFIGKRLDGRYEIRELIGVGGMAEVYKAYDCIEDRVVAVKILKEEYISNEEFITRFKNESKAIAVLNHPNIVRVYDVSFGDLIQYIVMEYVDGITLKQYIAKQGSLRWKDAVYLTIQVLRALQHAHDKGIVHRDVKPQNIMLLSDGTIKVTDFGIARFARSEHKTMTDKAIGSVHYISPEQARGDATDEKADIYSVGVMLYEMLTGRLPFEADSAVSVAIMQLQQDPVLPRDINDTIPVGLEQITMHAMQKDVSKRYKSAAEMLRDLEEFRRSPEMVFDYNYFVDNEPTKFIGAVTIDDEPVKNFGAVDDVIYGDDDDDEDDGEKSPALPILAGVAIAFIVVLIIAGIICYKYFFGGKSGKNTLTVPNFIGMTVSEIRESDIYSQFTFSQKGVESTEPAGTVIGQNFAKDRKIKKSQTIVLEVSNGPDLISIPDVMNLDLNTAKQTLKSKGFGWNIKYTTSDDIVDGHVVKTDPPATGVMAYGKEVDVYVSIGPQLVYVSNVNVTGYDIETAKKKIESADLKVGDIEYVDSNKPAGIVISQNPDYAYNATVIKGSAVNLSVSTGEVSYTYELDVKDLPDNFKENEVNYNNMKLSFTVAGVDAGSTNAFEANNPDLQEGTKSIKLKYKGNKPESVEVKVKITFTEPVSGQKITSLSNALIYNVNFKKGSAELEKNNITDEFLKNGTETTSSEETQSETSSETSSQTTEE